MFGFRNPRKPLPDNDVFDVADVQELAQTFPQKISSSENFKPDPNELISLESGEGFVVRTFVSRSLENELGKRTGRVPVATLAACLKITPKDLLRILYNDEMTFFSRNGSSVLTRHELKTVVEQLQSKAKELYVPAKVFADESDMDVKDVIRLVEMSDKFIEEGPLQFLEDPKALPSSSNSTSYPYIHTLSLLLKTMKSLNEKMNIAQEDAKPTSWAFSEMSGLSRRAFCRLAESSLSRAEEPSAIQGDFESVEEGARFIPHSYVLRKVKYHAREVARGDKPYCDLDNLSKLYPRLLPDVPSAQKFPYLKAFPREIHDKIRNLLHDRTILYHRENGANRGDILTLGDWLILGTLVDDLSSASVRLGTTIANEQWQIQSESPNHSPTLSPSEILERFHKETEMPLELSKHLWQMNGNGSISFAATTAFDTRVSQLQKESQNHFMSLWTSKVVLKSLLYTASLETLPAGPLKDQLSELLTTHLLQDLIPNTIKRAWAKGLIRTPNLSKQIGRLEAEITPTKNASKPSPQDSLSKFAKKISLEAPTSTQLALAKKEHLDDMAVAMSKDKDGPRLFLSLVIILCASKREGVVYATGKFAPKLLKVIKDELDESLYTRVEEIKELVKLGNVDKAVKVEMRDLAANVVRDMASQNGDIEPKMEESKAGNERWRSIYGDGGNLSLKKAAEPLIDSIQNEDVLGENGGSKEQSPESKIDTNDKSATG
ncbi:hypothetical protein FKW77_006052 [Venturia effusa]|uniref:Uncharacterized protein n=1 Tax=Venturia effusa TaxID=50376 RepID=A0A517KWI3_9PEZI|nr:hypothetical protein FKW77_006052 [Venturia effusa]